MLAVCIPGRVVILVQYDDRDGNDDDIVEPFVHLVLNHHREPAKNKEILSCSLYLCYASLHFFQIAVQPISYRYRYFRLVHQYP